MAKIGVTLSNRSVLMDIVKTEDLLRMAETADTCDLLSHVWVGDSLMAIPRLESLTLLSAIASRTTNIKIGTACMASLPLRDPIMLAYQWATLDVLSSGRTILGACMGGRRPTKTQLAEDNTMGIRNNQRAQRMEENIEILRKLWTKDNVSFQGKFHTLKNAIIEPKPIQKTPPIWIASSPRLKSSNPLIAERSLRRVSRMGDGWMTTAWLNYPGVVEEFRQLRTRIFEYASQDGKELKNFPCSLYYFININDNRETAYEESKHYLESYYSTKFSRLEVENWVAFGSAEECASRLNTFIEAGATDILLSFPSWSPVRQLNCLIDEVLPKLND